MLLLIACAPETDTAPKDSDTAAIETAETAIDTTETAIDTAETAAETGETAIDTVDTVDTDTGEPVVDPWAPPMDFVDAYHFTVPTDRGLVWEIDEDFAIDNYTVPQVFVAPDGRYGLFATNMGSTEDNSARTVFWSDDGVDWENGGVMFRPSDVPYDCGDRLEDQAVWEDGVTWRFILECSTPGEDGNPVGPRQFAVASSMDLESFDFDPAPMFAGTVEGEVDSVPYVLPFAEQDPRLFYNGDLTGKTTEGPGIRIGTIDPTTRLLGDIEGPITTGENVDPMPVYLEGGGIRLYHTDFGTPWSLAVVELDEDLTVSATPSTIVPGEGGCDGDVEGTCYADPTYIRLDDGTIYLYFTRLVRDPYGYTSSIGRAIAVD